MHPNKNYLDFYAAKSRYIFTFALVIIILTALDITVKLKEKAEEGNMKVGEYLEEHLRL